MYLLLSCVLVAQTSQPAIDVPAMFGSAAELDAKFSAALKAPDAFAELSRRKHAAGWNNLFAYAHVIEHQASLAFESGDYTESIRLAQMARELAPASIGARLLIAKAGLLSHPADIGANVRALGDVFRVAFSDYRFARLAIANVLTIAWVGFAALLTFILFVLFAHRARYVAHDLTTMMPRGSPRGYAYAIFALLLLAPLALRAGAWGVFFVLVLLPFMHEENNERILATIAFVGLSALPLALPAVTHAWVATEGRGTDLYRLTRSISADDAKARVEADLKLVDAVDAHAALGLYAKRQGDLAAAFSHFKAALAAQPQRADMLVNIGAVQFLQGDNAQAETFFDRAMSNDPQSVAAFFNASRMLYKQGEAERGTELLSRAQAANHDLTNVYGLLARAIGPRYMAEEVMPAKEIWRARPYASTVLLEKSAALSILPLLIGRADPSWWLVAALAFVVLAWGLALFSQRLEVALPCPRCGRPISKRTDKELPDRSLCGQCYHAFVLSDIETSARIVKEVQCLRYERRRSGLVTATTVMLAGTGHLLRNRPLSGFVFLLFAGSAWTLFVFSTATLPVPLRMGLNEAPLVGMTVAGVVWLLSVVFALISVPKKD